VPPPAPEPVPVPPPSGYDFLPSHPRIHLTPERLARLRAGYTTTSPLAKNVAAWVTPAAVSPEKAEELALAYAITEQSTYADAVARCLVATCRPGTLLTRDSGFDFRTIYRHILLALDWAYHGLTPEVRRQAATWLMDNADWVWPASTADPARKLRAWGAWPSNNYYWGFVNSALAALAAWEADGGVGLVSGSHRPSWHLRYILDVQGPAITRFLTGPAAGGAFNEGTNYDSGQRVGALADGLVTAGMSLPAGIVDWLHQSMTWWEHITLPGGGRCYHWGNQAGSSQDAMTMWRRSKAHYGAVRGHPEALRWLGLIGKAPASGSTSGGTPPLCAEEAVFVPTGLPPATPSVETTYYAAGSGVQVWRSSWTKDALWWATHLGANTEGHCFRAVGHLLIAVGGTYLLRSANMGSHSGINHSSRNHNVLMAGSRGQEIQQPNATWPKHAGTVTRRSVTPEQVDLTTDLAQAYVLGARKATDSTFEHYTRRIVFLPRRSAWVVVDRWQRKADKLEGDTLIRWHGGAKSPDVLTVTEDFRLVGHPTHDIVGLVGLVFGSPLVVEAEPFRLGPDTDPAVAGVQSAITSYAATIRVPPSSSPQTVITVLQAVPNGASGAPVAYNGTCVTVGDEWVEVVT
jgi:hypothetical protein